MNPEFQRNLWLELTPRRLALMPIVLGLIFLARTSLARGGELASIGSMGQALYFLLVVLWGTRTAAGAVVAEIRDRTWDGQRLSALTPWQMLWGKLLGATSYQWYGGLICLAVVALTRLRLGGLGAMVADVVYLLAIGLFAQSMALLASLVAVNRRAAHSRLDVFIYQFIGIAAAWYMATIWDAAQLTPFFLSTDDSLSGGTLTWFGMTFAARSFVLVSLLIFLAWSLVGNYTLLRGELQVKSGPLPFIGFLVFSVVYAAGFADGLVAEGQGLTTVRLAIAIAISAFLTYATVLLEFKDAVRYRRLLGNFGRGRVDLVLGDVQSWMCAFALLTGLTAYFLATFEPPLQEVFGYTDALAPGLAAAYFFVARDVAVFLYFSLAPVAKRGDFAALVTLGVLYGVLPAVVIGMGQKALLALFIPYPESHAFLAIGAPAVEALLVWSLAAGRLRQLLRPEAPAHSAL